MPDPKDYTTWIASYIDSVGGPAKTYGKCGAATASMVEAFPELRAVAGHVETGWGRRSHWWCMTPDGTILDPTAGQFPGGIFSYEEFKEGDDLRLGRCMNCGDEIWGPMGKGICSSMCSRECAEVFMREEMGAEMPPVEEDKNIYIKAIRPPGSDDE